MLIRGLLIDQDQSASTCDELKGSDSVHSLRRKGEPRDTTSATRQIPLGFVPVSGAVKTTFSDAVLKLAIAKPEGSKEAVQKIRISGS